MKQNKKILHKAQSKTIEFTQIFKIFIWATLCFGLLPYCIISLMLSIGIATSLAIWVERHISIRFIPLIITAITYAISIIITIVVFYLLRLLSYLNNNKTVKMLGKE